MNIINIDVQAQNPYSDEIKVNKDINVKVEKAPKHYFYYDAVQSATGIETLFQAEGGYDMSQVIPELLAILNTDGYTVQNTNAIPQLIAYRFSDNKTTGSSIRIYTDGTDCQYAWNKNTITFEMLHKKLTDKTVLNADETEKYYRHSTELIKKMYTLFKEHTL